MKKTYALINKKTGNVNRKAATREEARTLKRALGFKHSILNTLTGLVIR